MEVAEENVKMWENVCDVLISEKKGGYKTGHTVGSLFCNTGWKDTKMLALVISAVVRMTCISSWSLSVFSRFSTINLKCDFCALSGRVLLEKRSLTIY